MRQGNLEQLQRLTQVFYLREFDQIKGILAEEAVLRDKLARLESLNKDTRSSDTSDLTAKTVGADWIWQEWAMRNRRLLNAELSEVLSRKLSIMAGMRDAFGRDQAIKSLAEKDKTTRKAKIKSRQDAAISDRLASKLGPTLQERNTTPKTCS